MQTLERLGYSNWQETHIDPDFAVVHDLARVIAVHKNSYVISKGVGDVFAELVGRLVYTANSPLDFPCVGDWVYADFYDDNTHAIIHGVLPRKTLLKRKSAGKIVDFQLIAANIDYAFIVQSVDHNFNLRRIERYLVMVSEGGTTPVILLSKCDLLPDVQIEEIKDLVISVAPNTQVFAFSSFIENNISVINDFLLPRSTYCLIGSSGVGKTTLLNKILGEDTFATQLVSIKESKGKHTTTSRELVVLKNGALLVDTPGMRELGNISVGNGIEETFSDLTELESQCKFSNCSHTQEKGCAILKAIDEGVLHNSRYQNYVKMKSEARFYGMSYAEKRNKDKAFGRLIKSTLKNKTR